jgi:prepilin-type N-terminal cleavage/methylation domain-containing protein/prepilin-type processing-associated H-X9-DG protein
MKRGSKALRRPKDVFPGGPLQETRYGCANFDCAGGTVACGRGRRLAQPGCVGPGGFGLLELLVVMAIVLILFTLYWSFSANDRRKDARLNCSNNLQKIFLAMQIYSNEHSGGFPSLPGAVSSEEPLDQLVPHYTVDTPVFICPASGDAPLPAGESIRQRRISYAYYMGRRSTDADAPLMSDRQVDTQPKQAGQAVFSTTGKPPGNNHDERGGNFLFTDGHVDFSPPQTPFAIGLTQGVVLLNPKP